jgi:uncharacterized linocin/CFP29 family protein
MDIYESRLLTCPSNLGITGNTTHVQALYTALAETSDQGYPVLEHVERLVEGKIIWGSGYP